MRKILIGSALVLALSANAPQAELEPGEYETRFEQIKFDIPSLPDRGAQMATQMLPPPSKACLSATDIAQMKRQLTEPPHKMHDCKAENRSTPDHIDSTISCTTPKSLTSVKGTLTHFNLVTEIEMNPGEKTVMEMTVAMTRIGDCAPQ